MFVYGDDCVEETFNVMRSQESIDELYETESKLIDDALGLIKDKLKKEMIDNSAPQFEEIVTSGAIYTLQQHQEQQCKRSRRDKMNYREKSPLPELEELIKRYRIRKT